MTTQTTIDSLADRIEQAYCRRHPSWLATGLTPGVWFAAAVRLNEVALRNEHFPVDPELYVAVQRSKSFRRDPWAELTQEGALKRYCNAIRKIVRQLKVELASELNRSHRSLENGRTLEEILAASKSRISPLTKLVLCHNLDRPDLAAVIRPAAEAQHLACPLYRLACKSLLSTPDYPIPSRTVVNQVSGAHQHSFAWN